MSAKLSQNERNALNAKIMKAELMGNKELVEKLKRQLAECDRSDGGENEKQSGDRSSNVKCVTIAQKVKEENLSLKQMVMKEHSSSVEDETKLFLASCSKSIEDEYDEPTKKKKKVESSFQIVHESKKNEDECNYCLNKLKQQFLVAHINFVYLCIPENYFLVPNECHIRSISHVPCLRQADEDCINEVRSMKKSVCTMFENKGLATIFMETYYKSEYNLKHFLIHCIPIKKRFENDARMFFKKAILECEVEWSMNKKLIEIKDKCVTRMVPNGLSYFWVTFGDSNIGFAHVIEDERRFPKYFGQEVIGGLLDIEPMKWRSKNKQTFEQQLQRITDVKSLWKKLKRD